MYVIYFDHNATTPVHPDVFQAMEPYYKDQFGNASCLYKLGVNASYALEKSRMQMARLINAHEDEIIFTSGGTESDNLAIKGIVLNEDKHHVITSMIEHPAVMLACEFLKKYEECRVTYLPVDKNGRVTPEQVEESICPDTALVSIMSANNEIGSIQPIQEIARITKHYGIPFHTDAVQAAGKIPVDVNEMGVDLLSISSHKLYGPKGVGALYLRRGTEIIPQNHGGSHESGYRAGTENVPAIVGLGQASDLAHKQLVERREHLSNLTKLLWERLYSLSFEMIRNSPEEHVLPGTLNFSIPGLNARELVRAMDEEGICLSSGSACSQGKTKPSYVIKALGRSDAEALSTTRISLGRENNQQEVEDFIEAFSQTVQKLLPKN